MKDYSNIAEAEMRIAKSFFAYRDIVIASRTAKGKDPNAIPFSISLHRLKEDIMAIREAYDEARKEEEMRKYNARKKLVLELATHDLSEEEIQSLTEYDSNEIHRMLSETKKHS